MCGIAGIFSLDSEAGQTRFASATRKMTGLLARRGPDSEGFWSDPSGNLQLGFRRLSILDLSPAGNQPMFSQDGRSVLIFNGEIYNFRELRETLTQAGISFRSRSDTEVLLEGLNLYGVEFLQRLNGMFAIAWYSIPERRLILARDHAGIKPLYYFLRADRKGLAFSSQYNALLHTPWAMPGSVQRDVLCLYLRLHHIPPPFALLENTFQLYPGSYLSIDGSGRMEMKQWWKLPDEPQPDLNPRDTIATLRDTLKSTIERQRLADVPLGVFLSGGIDSPLVSAVTQNQVGPDLKAFTISSPGWWQDEGEIAREYARQMQVSIRVHNVTPEDALAAIPLIMEAQHEPFADFSILPTLLISRFAREEVTVALSGDGGDELFFGYERPMSLLRSGTDFRWPQPMRMALYAAGKYGLGPKRSDVIVSRTPGHYYFEAHSRLKKDALEWIAPDLKDLPSNFSLYDYSEYDGNIGLANYSRRVEFYGQLQRGLKKVDMASMFNSLEVRVPLLDRDVIDLSLRIDPFECMRNGTRKAVLRDLLGTFVPPESIPKPKRGFSIPLTSWLRGPLRSMIEDTLISRNLYPEGVFERKGVEKLWQQHLSEEADHKWGLWTLLALQWWAEKHLKPAVSLA
jgi:asparagine synthase (glutamine-hydrolysing)